MRVDSAPALELAAFFCVTCRARVGIAPSSLSLPGPSLSLCCGFLASTYRRHITILGRYVWTAPQQGQLLPTRPGWRVCMFRVAGLAFAEAESRRNPGSFLENLPLKLPVTTSSRRVFGVQTDPARHQRSSLSCCSTTSCDWSDNAAGRLCRQIVGTLLVHWSASRPASLPRPLRPMEWRV